MHKWELAWVSTDAMNLPKYHFSLDLFGFYYFARCALRDQDDIVCGRMIFKKFKLLVNDYMDILGYAIFARLVTIIFLNKKNYFD